MAVLITKTKVIETLQRLVNENGEDTRRGCFYVTGDEATGSPVPFCIAGCAFVEWGVSPTALLAVEGIPAVEVMLEKRLEGVELTEAAIGVLEIAQEAQDQGHTWGEALLRAKAEYLRGNSE